MSKDRYAADANASLRQNWNEAQHGGKTVKTGVSLADLTAEKQVAMKKEMEAKPMPMPVEPVRPAKPQPVAEKPRKIPEKKPLPEQASDRAKEMMKKNAAKKKAKMIEIAMRRKAKTGERVKKSFTPTGKERY